MQIRSAEDLTVYKKAYELAMEVLHSSKDLPTEERYSLIDQMQIKCGVRRGLYAHLRESWAKRRYEAHFASKLTDADGENGETETWLDFAHDSGYSSKRDHAVLTEKCAEI